MISQGTVAEICRLLGEGELNQRQIADRLGISRGTVNAIATGKRGRHGARPRSEVGLPYDPEDAPPVRCPGCGARVYLPCIACRARNYGYRKRKGTAA